MSGWTTSTILLAMCVVLAGGMTCRMLDLDHRTRSLTSAGFWFGATLALAALLAAVSPRGLG